MSQMFRTESEVMVATAGNVDGVNSNVQAELNRLRGVVDGLRGAWAGNAQVSFDNLMERYNTAAHQLQEALASISDNLRSNAHNFSDVEATNAQAFNAVATPGLNL
ncbi:WXG100 family type VII secretion target [Corynebacterium yudongzhengii]|uniref:ESAT-6-like protein n=1 Tax=Corynebacterium yudongzhengii TaxID=2080740 RepID=A0A2U1TA80_9CORY|nr:WXG100 family type VII secretion target [Corynebacterium yudongzhengii]AWB81286.1 WXG100 family type VII secretion target [Corynebacterium yudongzhengii]PWC02825.1 WXG100 family type VII secretion target [Corynebacterium yudongzhengii]